MIITTDTIIIRADTAENTIEMITDIRIEKVITGIKEKIDIIITIDNNEMKLKCV